MMKFHFPKHFTTSAPTEVGLVPTIAENARTTVHICKSGTLSSSLCDGTSSVPFGAHVDYIVDDRGCPIILLHNQSQIAKNVFTNPSVSLFCQPSSFAYAPVDEGLSQTTIIGDISLVPSEELSLLKLAFPIVHRHTDNLINYHHFQLFRIQPKKICYSRGDYENFFWVDSQDFMNAKPDVLAYETQDIINRLNSEQSQDLQLLCKHFIGRANTDSINVHAIDRLGIDIKIRSNGVMEDFRVGYRHPLNIHSAEDAKSELMKLFQEAWERDQGDSCWDQSFPPICKYQSASCSFLSPGGSSLNPSSSSCSVCPSLN